MKRYHIALLSALIFLAYGLLTNKLIFTGLGTAFIFIALAEYLRKK